MISKSACFKLGMSRASCIPTAALAVQLVRFQIVILSVSQVPFLIQRKLGLIWMDPLLYLIAFASIMF